MGKKILVVEDEMGPRELISAYLRDWGYVAVSAENGEAGLEKYIEDPEGFSLVITDLEMPGINGLELSKTLKNSGYKIPVVLWTGSDIDDIGDYRECGIVRLLKKPLELNELQEVVKEIVDGKNQSKSS